MFYFIYFPHPSLFCTSNARNTVGLVVIVYLEVLRISKQSSRFSSIYSTTVLLRSGMSIYYYYCYCNYFYIILYHYCYLLALFEGFSINCTFEEEHICGYERVPEGDAYKFLRWAGSTFTSTTANPSGPSEDHTLGPNGTGILQY